MSDLDLLADGPLNPAFGLSGQEPAPMRGLCISGDSLHATHYSPFFPSFLRRSQERRWYGGRGPLDRVKLPTRGDPSRLRPPLRLPC